MISLEYKDQKENDKTTEQENPKLPTFFSLGKKWDKMWNRNGKWHKKMPNLRKFQSIYIYCL